MGLKLPRAQTHGRSPSHARAPQQERAVALRLGAQTVIASGSLSVKGDVRMKRVLRLECKTTKNHSFSVTREMVKKIEDAALASTELPAILIEFIDDKGKPLMEIAVVPSYVLEMITNHASQ